MKKLSPELCSVHTHSTLCDGKSTPEEMAAAAYAAGVRYFGFSGHSHTACPEVGGDTLDADMTDYRETVLRLRREYEGRMEILLGLEWDLCSDVSPAGFDYWIGSTHNFHDRETGNFYSVDWTLQSLAKCCVEMFRGSFPALIGQYYADVAAVAAKKPTILGHFDLICKLNGGGELFDEEDRHYRAAALASLHTADPTATLLEVNTGAISRGYRTTPYPALFLLREWKKMGGSIILTSDSHSADTVIYGYEAAAELAKAGGFADSVLLTARGPESCPLV